MSVVECGDVQPRCVAPPKKGRIMRRIGKWLSAAALSTAVVGAGLIGSAAPAHADSTTHVTGCSWSIKEVKSPNGVGTVLRGSLHCTGTKLSPDSIYYKLWMTCSYWGIRNPPSVAPKWVKWGSSSSSWSNCGYWGTPVYLGLRTSRTPG